jgi:hypothetical protein
MKETLQLHVNDVMNVRLWVENKPLCHYFLYHLLTHHTYIVQIFDLLLEWVIHDNHTTKLTFSLLSS